jgi:hypothetical protein
LIAIKDKEVVVWRNISTAVAHKATTAALVPDLTMNPSHHRLSGHCVGLIISDHGFDFAKKISSIMKIALLEV